MRQVAYAWLEREAARVVAKELPVLCFPHARQKERMLEAYAFFRHLRGDGILRREGSRKDAGAHCPVFLERHL